MTLEEKYTEVLTERFKNLRIRMIDIGKSNIGIYFAIEEHTLMIYRPGQKIMVINNTQLLDFGTEEFRISREEKRKILCKVLNKLFKFNLKNIW